MPESIRMVASPAARLDRRAAFALAVDMAAWPRLFVAGAGIMLCALLLFVESAVHPGLRFEALYLLVFIAVAWSGHAGDALLIALVGAVPRFVLGSGLSGPLLVPLVTGALGLAGTALIIGMTAWLRDAVVALDRQARIDPLTGVLNNRSFRSRADIERLRASRAGAPISVAFLDLDDFKALNDRSGHLAGDEALRRFAAVITSSIRSYDLVGRVGGDEFVVFLPEADVIAASAVIRRIKHLAGRPSLRLAFSAGIATFPSVPDSLDAMIHEADELMYVAKRRGRGRHVGRVAGEDGLLFTAEQELTGDR